MIIFRNLTSLLSSRSNGFTRQLIRISTRPLLSPPSEKLTSVETSISERERFLARMALLSDGNMTAFSGCSFNLVSCLTARSTIASKKNCKGSEPTLWKESSLNSSDRNMLCDISLRDTERHFKNELFSYIECR